MPLEFALRPRFDLNRPPKRRRFSGLELPPLALPIAAYWLAIAGGTYALVQSREADASLQTQHDAVSDGSQVVDDVSNDARAGWSPTSEISGSAAAATNEAPVPLPVAEPHEPAPSQQPVVDTIPHDRTALSRGIAPRDPAPPRSRMEAPPLPGRAAPEPFPPLEPAPEPAPRRHEVANRVLDTETPKREAPSSSLPSCESAAETANQTMDLGARRGAPDLTRDAFAAVLENGSYLGACAIPERTGLEICAAVQDGRVVGVSVSTEPRDAAINACVRRAVAALRFPRNSQLDVTRTRFEPTR